MAYTSNNCLSNTVKTIPNQTKQEVVNYSYDKNGNLISMSEGSINPPKNINVVSFGIYTADELPLSYRENTYNEFNQLIKTVDNEGNTSTYTYLPTGLRWSKNVNGTETKFLWDGDNVYAEMDSNNIATNVYTRGVDLIKNNSNTFYLKNAHGDITQLADVNGTVTKNYEYDAFGNESETDSTDTNPFRYCGEYFDDETGYVYLRNRYYDPSLGSFISEDTYWNTNNMIYGKSWDSEKPKVDVNAIKQSCNLYVYCMNNSINYKDSRGLNTYAIGANVAVAFGIRISGESQIIIDDEGNVGIASIVSGGGGFPAVGVAATITITNAETIFDVTGMGGSAGGSLNIKGLSGGSDFSVGSSRNGKPVYGISFSIGGKASLPVEMHGGVSYTAVKKISLPTIIARVIKAFAISEYEKETSEEKDNLMEK